MVARTLTGKVTSDKMNKTIVVVVPRYSKHSLYGKAMKRTTKLHAHDENNECKIGDVVVIQETKPISKTKAWTLVNKVDEERP